MNKRLKVSVDELVSKLVRANELLVTLCLGLEESEIPFPPDLLDWWISHKKDLEEDEKPRIQLVN